MTYNSEISRRTFLEMSALTGLGGAFAVLATACGSSGGGHPGAATRSPSSSASTGTATPAKNSGGPLKVAILQPTTGTLAAAYGSLFAPLQLAISEINAAGGLLGSPIDTTVFNDEASTSLEGGLAEKIVSDGLHYVAGPVGSSPALASYAITQKHQIIQAGLTQSVGLVDVKKYPGVFTPNILSPTIGKVILDGIVKAQGRKRLAFLYEDTDYGAEGLAYVKSYLNGTGASLVSTQSYQQGAPTTLVNLQRVVTAKPDALIMWTSDPADLTNIFMSIQEVKLNMPIATSSSFTSYLYNLLPKSYNTAILENTRCVAPKTLCISATQPLPSRVRQYMSKLFTKYSVPGPTKFAELQDATPMFYDFMYILKDAVEAAGTLDYESVLNKLQTMPKYTGPVLSIQFTAENHNGLSPSDFVLAKPVPASTPNSSGGVFPQAV